MTEPHSISTWAKQDQETQLNAHTDIYIGKIIYRIIVAATKDQCTYLRREVSGNTSGEFVIPTDFCHISGESLFLDISLLGQVACTPGKLPGRRQTLGKQVPPKRLAPPSPVVLAMLKVKMEKAPVRR